MAGSLAMTLRRFSKPLASAQRRTERVVVSGLGDRLSRRHIRQHLSFDRKRNVGRRHRWPGLWRQHRQSDHVERLSCRGFLCTF